MFGSDKIPCERKRTRLVASQEEVKIQLEVNFYRNELHEKNGHAGHGLCLTAENILVLAGDATRTVQFLFQTIMFVCKLI